MKAVLISIQPKWCELIASGKKTIEVRKTKPKLETPFKCYIYCTQNTPYNPVIPMRYEKEGGNIYTGGKRYAEFLTSRVIGEFVCDRIDGICWASNSTMLGWKNTYNKNSCLTDNELYDYSNGDLFYEWHISDLVIYDEPKDLSEFKRACPDNVYSCAMCRHGDYTGMKCTPITRPPQSYMFVEELKGD